MRKGNMKKIYTSIILTLLLLATGCSIMDSKDSLIDKANQGDIKSMVALGNTYDFGSTKEGLKQYKIWANNIDKNASSEDILALTKMFNEEKLTFPKGRVMYEKLLKLANSPANKQATLALINFYSKLFSQYEVKDIESVFVKTASKQDLFDLYNLYQATDIDHGFRYTNRDRIKTILVAKGYMKNSDTDSDRLSRILGEKSYIKESSWILANVLKSNDLEKVYGVGMIIGNWSSSVKAIKILIRDNTEALMKKALTLQPNDERKITALFYLCNLYTQDYHDDLARQKRVLSYLDLMGKTEYDTVLDVLYDIDKGVYDKNVQFFDKILKNARNKAYMNIAHIYHYGTAKQPVDIALAKTWYKKADTKKAKEALVKLNKVN